MMIGIFAIVIIAIAVTGTIAWKKYSKEKNKAREEIDRLTNAQAYKMRILRLLMTKPKKSAYKMTIMETLSMNIELMKVCEEQLKKEKLVTCTPHVMTLTDFGKKFAQIYAEQEGAKG